MQNTGGATSVNTECFCSVDPTAGGPMGDGMKGVGMIGGMIGGILIDGGSCDSIL